MQLNKLRLDFLFLVLPILAIACTGETAMFRKIPPGQSGIGFNNLIVENDSVNQLDNENVYNGAGIAIADFDNNGLQDIYFTGNLVPSRLYLNTGKFRFRDVTNEAGVDGGGKWCRGAAAIDINNDGLIDLYVSASQLNDPEKRKNLLYINKGLNENNIPVFVEDAAGYGLDDNSHTTQANFFDYDNDGDLDVYLVVNEITERISPYIFRPVLKDGHNPSSGKLYRNDWDSALNHPVFTDVSKEAGIETEGYSHSAIITDINMDGWKDIYLGNDFLTNDLLWINNGDGTFTDKLKDYFKHTSANTMGNDVADINNDGLPDVISLDMNPEDNYRKKMMLPASSYQTYQNTERYGYSYQYIRNVLQLNQGFRPGKDPVPVFSDIGYFAGITATDWSWTPLLTDFDNDGYRDLIISNGFPKDITDHDFGMFRVKGFKSAPKEVLLKQIPEVKIHNYAFRNNGNFTFTDVSDEWGMNEPSFSNGSAYADLDNDGDLDLIYNNINDEASVYRNYQVERSPGKSHFLRIRLEGQKHNRQGLGTWVEIYYDNGKMQVWEFSPYRGYLSSVENIAHFGTGETRIIDSLIVKWPDQRMQVLRKIETNRQIILKYDEAYDFYNWKEKEQQENSLFREITDSIKLTFIHSETDFVDFNIQKLLPHKFSESGPAIAAGDINNDGLDDIVVGGSANNSAVLLFQQKDGSVKERPLLPENIAKDKKSDDAGILLFDADNDGDLDMYIASGGYENPSSDISYRDHLYLNNGKGNFREITEAIPENYTSKSCVRAADFDRDGDLDLLIAGKIDPWNYPRPVSSIILRNDSHNGKISFSDVTSEVAEALINIGMVNDALFTDFDNDGWQDLVLAGEWMPLTFLKNENGTFRNITPGSGINEKQGWWRSIASGDFDNDGDIDFIAGNLGLNSFYKAEPGYPVCVYASDFDVNGSYDAFTTIFLPSSQEDTTRKEFPVHGRDDAVKQMIGLRTKFQNYKSYAFATISDLFPEDRFKNSLMLQVTCFESSYCRNDGNGKFTLIPLPAQAQFSAINGIVTDDFDGDGSLDVMIIGNDYGADVLIGRYDAMNGLILKGDGKGGFSPLSISESGIYIPGNGRSLARLKSNNGSYLIAATQNRGPLRLFELNRKTEMIALGPGDASAELIFEDGTRRKAELHYGSSYLSQSAGYILAEEGLKKIIITSSTGLKRSVDVP